jgi:hypothetical protein
MFAKSWRPKNQVAFPRLRPSFVLGIEAACRRTIRINPGEFPFQFLTP